MGSYCLKGRTVNRLLITLSLSAAALASDLIMFMGAIRVHWFSTGSYLSAEFSLVRPLKPPIA